MKTTSVKLAGGTAAVSTGIEDGLKNALGATNVKRNAGVDRYETAATINKDAFAKSNVAYLATGSGFADALAGAALAAADDAPLFITAPNCFPAVTVAGLERLAATVVTLLGGPAVLGGGVEELAGC